MKLMIYIIKVKIVAKIWKKKHFNILVLIKFLFPLSANIMFPNFKEIYSKRK